MNQPPCTYPVINNLAIGARPKVCGKEGGILAEVPYQSDEFEGPKMVLQMICLDHACEAAAWKLARSIPFKAYTAAEIMLLLGAGYHIDELQ